MRLFLICLLLCSCGATASPIPACSVNVISKKDFTGTETQETKCDCTCPPAKTNVLEFGGIIGGLANLFSSGS